MTMAQITEHRRLRQRRHPGRIESLLILLETWRRRSRERQALASLSDLELRDIGANRCDALTEASKPFWRA